MWRDAVIHRSQGMAQDRIEIIGCLQYQTLHFCRILNHRPPMAGAEAHGLASRYRAQPVGPVPRVALHLLRVAGVRHRVDDKIIGAYNPSFRHQTQQASSVSPRQ